MDLQEADQELDQEPKYVSQASIEIHGADSHSLLPDVAQNDKDTNENNNTNKNNTIDTIDTDTESNNIHDTNKVKNKGNYNYNNNNGNKNNDGTIRHQKTATIETADSYVRNNEFGIDSVEMASGQTQTQTQTQSQTTATTTVATREPAGYTNSTGNSEHARKVSSKVKVARSLANAIRGVEHEQLKPVSMKERFRLLFLPIYKIEEIGKTDRKLHIVIVPEAFRMLFYVGFMVFFLISYLVTRFSGNLDLNDNPILNRFGTNNMCVYFDEKPFIYFSCFLYIFLLLILLTYELTEWYRVYDAWRDDHLFGTKTFRLYSACTIFEIVAYVYFVQVFSVRPTDNIFIHTLPYFGFILALWVMSFKHAVYFIAIRIVDKWWQIMLLRLYCAALLATAIGKIAVGFPNLLGYEVWTVDGFEWTPTFSEINGNFFDVLVVPIPVITYLFIIDKLSKINIIVNRDRYRESVGF